MVIFAIVFLVSAGILVDYFIKSQKQQSQFDELSNLVQQDTPDTPNNGDNAGGNPQEELPVYAEITHPDTGEKMEILREYSSVFQKNTDMVGWVKINNTNINYPVLQTPDYVNFYLYRSFYKEDSKHGCIYVNEMADVNLPSDNVTLYGHNMSDGSMFAGLHNYNKQKFYAENPYISFNTLTERHVYQIFAVFYTTDLIETGFAYHNFVNGNQQQFTDFVAECKRLSLYDTGVTATYGDKLLTLSTCDSDYSDPHGRFAVVAKRIY